MKLKNLIPLFPAALILAAAMFSHSCANTTQPPSGGPKDTIPPRLVDVNPFPGTTNVPLHGTKLKFKFNEYVIVKEGKNIFLSPPLSKPPKYRISEKSLIVSFEEDLQPNTTYSLDITGAIVDNNEGNPFPGFSLTFSTGERVDSMYITGVVQDCNTLDPVKGATVMLYKDQADSAIFKSRPVAAAKTDDWGYFVLRNIQDTLFRLYAIMDEDNNNIYNPETDKVAFCDSLVRPVGKIGRGIYELFKFDMKDTLSCRKRKTEYELNLFLAKNAKQAISSKERIGERTSYIKFMAPYAQVSSVSIKGVPQKKLLTHFNSDRDSMLLWVNDLKPQPDTFFVDIKYMKTDSTGVLVPAQDRFKLGKPKELKAKASKSARKNIKHEDTIAVYKVISEPENFEMYGISVAFDYPLVKEAFDSLKYEVTNARQKVSKGSYTWSRDTSDIRVFHIMNKGKIQKGFQYKFTIPARKFRDINGFWNDSLVVNIKLPEDDKLSSLTLNMQNVGSTRYIVDLMNEKRDKVIRSYTIDSNKELYFPYLKDGKYCVRLTEDKNRNNRVDTGDLLEHRQPEKVKFYKLKGDNIYISLPVSTDLSQDINVGALFN